jgi:uncharacterized protein YbjT (DUF2867 family)
MNNQENITVFGATGKIGRELLIFLSEAKIPTVAVTRNKSKAITLPFIEWMKADLSNRETLADTLKNSKAVFLCSSLSENYVQEQNNVIETAKNNGVKHLVKLSSPGAAKDSPIRIAKLHGEIEELLKTSDVPYTILQPNSFMQNWLGEFSQTVQKERKIYEATGDGKKPYLDARDIAEVACKVLREPVKHLNKTYLLTGGEAVNFTQVALAISNEINEKVEFVSLTSEEAKERMKQKGMPDWAVQTFLAIAEGQRNGKAAFVNNTVSEILGKPPRTIEDFVKTNIEWFK